MLSLPKTILFIIFATTLSLSLKSKSHTSLTTQPISTPPPVSPISHNNQHEQSHDQNEEKGPVITQLNQEAAQKPKQETKEESKEKTKNIKTKDSDKDEADSSESETDSDDSQTQTDTQQSNKEQPDKKTKKQSMKASAKNIKKVDKKHLKSKENTDSEGQEESSSEEEDQEEEQKPILSHASALPAQEPNQQYKTSVVVFVCIYGGIVVFVLFLIKVKAQESHAANLIDALLEMTIYRAMQFYFARRNGYQPSTMNEEAGEDIDRGDSVAIGYSAEQGRQLFWERNSATGI